MWFNNIQVFQYEFNENLDLEAQLAQTALKPCPPHARFIYGWLPVIHQQFTHQVTGGTLICMGKEERILPKGVIARLLNERIQAIEANQQRPIKRAQKKQMAEELEFELLPKAFCVQKRTFALFDHINKRLIINASSPTQAALLTSLLRKSCMNIQLQPVDVQEHLATQLTSWIKQPDSLSPVLQLASDCVLIDLQDQQRRVNCKGYELPSEDIIAFMAQDLACQELSLIWNERIQFTLTKDMILKRVKCLDYLQDAFNETQSLDELEKQDAALALLLGELQGLLNDLLHHVSPNDSDFNQNQHHEKLLESTQQTSVYEPA